MASADFEQFNGSGGVLGKATVVGTNGVEFGPFQPTSGTYTLSANCTGTLTVDIAGTTAVFDLYASPSGDVVNEVMTEVDGAPGSPDADTETRVSPSDLIHSR
ncbi:MAG TPA: hypothetical protein VG186_08215 [Solirubrobacteraceae bacterium]|nr:hypothetical protein [Solirubrobacteraceae bacterium]